MQGFFHLNAHLGNILLFIKRLFQCALLNVSKLILLNSETNRVLQFKYLFYVVVMAHILPLWSSMAKGISLNLNSTQIRSNVKHSLLFLENLFTSFSA